MRSFYHVSAAVAASLVAACGGGDGSNQTSNLVAISTVSSRPDMVSGGSTLVEVTLPAGMEKTSLKMAMNGSEVSSNLQSTEDPKKIVALLEGLRVGENSIEVISQASGTSLARISVRNSDIAGPIFAGPHQRPWICETQASGLGAPPATGPCKAQNVVEWFYKNTSGKFAPLTNLAKPYPSDMVKTTTIDGNTVDFIVRVEGGAIDETIYRIAIIDDPANPINKPWSTGGKKPGTGWNGKLFYQYVGGASPGYRSGRNDATIALQSQDSIRTTDDALNLGFAVVTGSRNVFGTGQDDVISAESTSMIKEHFIKNYGRPKFTIGLGSSGGSMQVHLIAQNYPGLLDGIIPVRTYPDQVSIVSDVVDCQVLGNYFTNNKSSLGWTVQQISKVDGYSVTADNTTTCLSGWSGFANSWHNPSNRNFDAAVSQSLRYNPATNRAGARGDYWSNNVNSFGLDPATGFARSAYDNVGIQYGLGALNSGDITVAQFLDLNEKAGGIDVDGNIKIDRSSADPIGIVNAYASGRLNAGVRLTLPMIEYRNYVDLDKNIHTRHRTFAKVDRMIKANGSRDNMVYWMVDGDPAKGPNTMRLALTTMNDWLNMLIADNSGRDYPARVIASKPAAARDACWDASSNRIDEALTLNPLARCNQLYPIHADPRIVAGAPRSGDILKCQLKPVNFSDYTVAFNSAERTRLSAIFPAGVCDWSKPGVGQQQPAGSWLVFGQTPGTWAASNP
ncbi:DUF6351 family protein [uncultured Xylophilus sp.]|uniref:DUF6351 family protein n=1 Tax=uncultured Xylophilus sp. TaxID=296832 RepID=UPI0025DEAD48|nr:DUF6351 family protein [uncultured Xylophilus sp.]